MARCWLFGLLVLLSAGLAGGPGVAAAVAAFCQEPAVADAVVVLGASVGSGGRPSPALRARAERGIELLHAGRAPVLVGTGGVGAFPPAEGAVIAQLAIEQGVPPAAVVIENRARSTEESAIFLRQLADGYGWRRLILVSDAYHLPRAAWLFQERGFEVQTACTDASGYRRETLVYQALREIAGVLAYTVTRWLVIPGSAGLGNAGR